MAIGAIVTVDTLSSVWRNEEEGDIELMEMP